MKQQPTIEQATKPHVEPMKLIARVIPILGPVPTMISVYDAATKRLGWNPLAAGSAALLIELLGFFSVNLAERMWSYNKGLRADEIEQKLEAPTWKAIMAAMFYLVVVEAMIALVDIKSGATIWLPVTLPIAGIIGSTVYALWTEQDERERTVRTHRAKLDAEAAAQKQAKAEAKAQAKAERAQVRAQGKRTAGAPAPSADAVRAQVRDECAALAAQYACTEPQCGWSPSVDALMKAQSAGKNPKSAAASAKAGHVKNRHKTLADGLFDPAIKKVEQA